MSRRIVYLVGFLSGAVVLGAEVSAGRLVAPYYGTSSLVWSLVIGTVLSALAVGNIVGGRLSRSGSGRLRLVALFGLSGVLLAALPVLGRSVMVGSLTWFESHALGHLAASAVGVTVLLGGPLVALGAVGPLLIHQAVDDIGTTGSVAGRLYAAQTAGSLVGTYLVGLALVPLVGTTRTLWGGAAVLLVLAALLLPHARVLVPATAAVCGLALVLAPVDPARRSDTVFETETAHNYIRVTDDGLWRGLYLNEGHAVQSLARSNGELPLRSVWSYYALAPAWTQTGRPSRILLLGLGGGTSARIYRALYPDVEITGVELDPGVVEVGREYFGLPDDVSIVIDDARAFLQRDEGAYDLIVVDAFRFPYVPFQLTTREFFALAREHLAPGGALVVNAGRDGNQYDVVDAIAFTMSHELPVVRAVDVDNRSNTILVGTRHDAQHDAGLDPLVLAPEPRRNLRGLHAPTAWRPRSEPVLLTDDLAPVELLTDRIVARNLIGARASGGGRVR